MKVAVKLAVLALVVQGTTDLQAGAQKTTAAGQERKIVQRKAVAAKKPAVGDLTQKWPKPWVLAALASYTSGAAVPLETAGSGASEGPLPNPYPEGYRHIMNNAYYHNGAQCLLPSQAATMPSLSHNLVPLAFEATIFGLLNYEGDLRQVHAKALGKSMVQSGALMATVFSATYGLAQCLPSGVSNALAPVVGGVRMA